MNRRTALTTFLGSAALMSVGGVFPVQSRTPIWHEVTPETEQFSIRDSARGFVFQDRLWLSGGYMVGNVPRRDLLSSNDGIHWQMVNPSTPFAAYSPITAHNGKMVATYPAFLSSVDGRAWTREETKGDLPPLAAEKPILSFGGNLVLLAESYAYVHDGKVWTRVETPFQGWLAFSAVVHNGKIVVAGGAVRKPGGERGYRQFTSHNEVWETRDPLDSSAWVRLVSDAEWRDRMWPALVVHNDWIYLIGGYVNQEGTNTDDVWRSSDGVRWQYVQAENSPSARHAPTVFSHRGKIILLAGNTNKGTSVQNDIWTLTV